MAIEREVLNYLLKLVVRCRCFAIDVFMFSAGKMHVCLVIAAGELPVLVSKGARPRWYSARYRRVRQLVSSHHS